MQSTNTDENVMNNIFDCKLSPIANNLQTPGQSHLEQHGHVNPIGDSAGGTSIPTKDTEADNPPDPPGDPETDIINLGQD